LLCAAALGVLALGLVPGIAARAADAVAVVVSAQWPELQQISALELRRLYLGQRTRFGSVRVACLDLRSGSQEREAFSLAVLGRSELALHEYWIQQALTGGNLPPRELDSPSAVLERVSSQVGVIGYLRWSLLRAQVPPEIRVLRVVDARGVWHPGERGYPIQIRESIEEP
jgi:hypothetical protein